MMEIYALPAAFYSVSSISHSLGRHFLTQEYLMNLHVTDVGKKYILIKHIILNVHCFTAKGHCIIAVLCSLCERYVYSRAGSVLPSMKLVESLEGK